MDFFSISNAARHGSITWLRQAAADAKARGDAYLRQFRRAAAYGAINAFDRRHIISVLVWLRQEGLTLEECGDSSIMIREAAIHGDLSLLLWLEKEFGSAATTVEQCRAQGGRALYWAARHGHLEIMNWLHERGAATAADYRIEDCRILLEAVSCCRYEVIMRLAEHGAATKEDFATLGWLSLRRAALAGSRQMVEYICAMISPEEEFEAYQRDGFSVIHKAAARGDLYMLDRVAACAAARMTAREFALLCCSPDPETLHYYEAGRASSKRPLELAAKGSHLLVLKWLRRKLVAGGLSVQDQCRRDQGAVLAIAAARGPAIMNWVEAQGAGTLDDYRADELRPLRLAAHCRHIDSLERIEQKYADFKMQASFIADCRKGRLLPDALQRGDIEVARWLAARGIKPSSHEAPDIINSAASRGDFVVLEWLEKHVSITTEMCRATSALYGAAIFPKMEILLWLERHGAATRDDCRADDCAVLKKVIAERQEPFSSGRLCSSPENYFEVLCWLADRMPKEDFERCGCGDIWQQRWDEKIALATLASHRGKSSCALPPQVWGLVHDH